MRAATSAVLGLAATVALTACGSNDGTDPAASESAAPVSTSTSAAAEPSGDGSSTSDQPGGDDTSPAGALGEGDFLTEVAKAQKEAGSFTQRLTFDLGEQGRVEQTSDYVLAEDPREILSEQTTEAEFSGTTTQTTVILADGVIYTREGEAASWMSMTFEEMAKVNPAVEELLNLSPDQVLGIQQDAITAFSATDETRTIDGVEARRYDLTLDGQDLGTLAGAPAASDALPAEVDAQWWVDASGLSREVSMDLGDDFEEPIVMTFENYGEDFDITPPPADQVQKWTAPPSPTG